MCRAPWCGPPLLRALPQGDRTPHYGCSEVTTQATHASLPKLTGQYAAEECMHCHAGQFAGQRSRVALRLPP
jgi:hypothetical protein